MDMVRRLLEPLALDLTRKYPVLTITGPRQSGKTTFAKTCFPDMPYVSFETPDTKAFFLEDPRGFLAKYREGAVFDEAQRVPDLGSWLQELVDENPSPGRFILTGSAQFELLSQVSQSLAGRTALLRLLPFSLRELRLSLPGRSIDQWLFSGFYPRIHDMGLDPYQAYGDYVQTYVERDVRQFSEIKNLALFQRFLKLCAGRVGQLLNLDSLGSDAGVSGVTARHWITILEASYIVFLLPPWFGNAGKRLIKSSKLYFHDVGLASYLLGMEDVRHLANHPLRGNLFENMMLAEGLKHRYNRGKTSGMYFYRDAKGLEMDLLFPDGPRFVPVEIKAGLTVASDFFAPFANVKNDMGDRLLDGLLVYGGDERQSRGGVRVCPFEEMTDMLP